MPKFKCQTNVKNQNVEIELKKFELWILRFDIALGRGLGIIFIKIISCFLIIL